jgi:hypothetical protein
MLQKLQRKTLIPSQMAAYTLSLLVGAAIALLSLQLYADLKPLLNSQTDVFRAHTVTVSKTVTAVKTARKKGIYFTDKELQRLKQQEFVKEVAQFNSSTFNVSAAISFGGQQMSTDLFFESVPDGYVDIQSDDWRWDSTSNFLPIVIPEDYLNLYNFGFAESQSLPVVAPGLLSQVTFNVFVEGNGKRKVYNSRIVGLSSKINSILVPEDFLLWANREFGAADDKGCSRLLVEFSDASDERIAEYFKANGLNINKAELESSKMAFFFRLAMGFVMAIAVVIILLSMALIVMSMNLIVHRNREMFINLRNIGYSVGTMSRFYKVVTSLLTVGVIVLSAVIVVWIRSYYLARLSTMFNAGGTLAPTIIGSLSLAALLLVICNHSIVRTIKRIIR